MLFFSVLTLCLGFCSVLFAVGSASRPASVSPAHNGDEEGNPPNCLRNSTERDSCLSKAFTYDPTSLHVTTLLERSAPSIKDEDGLIGYSSSSKGPRPIEDSSTTEVMTSTTSQFLELRAKTSVASFSPRAAHPWAMSCLDNQKYTSICQSVGYYCNSDGRLSLTADGKRLAGCESEGECECINLFPQPKCFWSYAGSVCVQTKRELEELKQDSEATTEPESNSSDIASLIVPTNTAMLSDSEPFNNASEDTPVTATLSIKTEHDVDTDTAVQIGNGNNYAMNCADSMYHTETCQIAGYYCSDNGRLRARVREDMCEHDCVCVNLFPGPRCFGSWSGSICIREEGSSTDAHGTIGEVDAGMEVKPPMPPPRPLSSDASRLKGPGFTRIKELVVRLLTLIKESRRVGRGRSSEGLQG